MATKMADGKVVVNVIGDKEILMSEKYACPNCDFSLPELEPRMFSFNAPYGACPMCKGLGVTKHISENLLIPDRKKSILDGAIKTLTIDDNIDTTRLLTIAKALNIDLSAPIGSLDEDQLKIILYGTDEEFSFEYTSKNGNKRYTTESYEGIITNLERRYVETNSTWIREWIDGYMIENTCPLCHGSRLREEILSVKVGRKNIWEVTNLSIKELISFFQNLKLNKSEREISDLIIKEIKSRLEFLDNVGLNYLTLSRSASTLSGGEAQRIRLATQIGSQLSGVLYVLDEPSIGLHQKDNDRLINSLKNMRDLGNTLIVVEHDEDTMREADYLIDIGPVAGSEGGYVVAAGTPEEVMKNENSITGRYLSGKECIPVPKKRRKGNGEFITIKGARENNLKNINVKFPLGTFTCVTGVSGSGKSTLVNEILCKSLEKCVYDRKVEPGKVRSVTGVENVDKVIQITQDPIGRTPRSNPATYTGVFDDIRDVFAEMKESKFVAITKVASPSMLKEGAARPVGETV